MSNSFKNLQNKILQLKKELEPNEPKRREDAIKYTSTLTTLIKESYESLSTDDYMFIKTLSDHIVEVKYFGGFTKQAKERLLIIEKRYNYIHEEKGSDI